MNLNALYVGVTDMDRAVEFYRDVFNREPIQLEDRFSMFDVGGTGFGLFAAAVDGEELVFGNNCVPNIEVDDIDAEYERLAALVPRIDETIRTAGRYRYFQFTDTEGNLVELYASE